MEQHEHETVLMHSVRPGEIVFEVDNERIDIKTETRADNNDPLNPMKMTIVTTENTTGNCHELFPPYETRKNKTNFVRSRRVLMRDGPLTRFSMDPALQAVDYIPGERIHVDIENRKGRITDAIFDRENGELRVKLLGVASNLRNKILLVPGEYVEVDLKTDNQLWEWIFWMRRIADGDVEHDGGPPQHPGCATKGSRRCRPVQNMDLLPSLADCAKSLKVTILQRFNRTADAEKSWDEERKEKDPDYKRQIGHNITLTPYLAGTLQESGSRS